MGVDLGGLGLKSEQAMESLNGLLEGLLCTTKAIEQYQAQVGDPDHLYLLTMGTVSVGSGGKEAGTSGKRACRNGSILDEAQENNSCSLSSSASSPQTMTPVLALSYECLHT